VLYGDMPLVTAGTLAELRAKHRERRSVVTLLSATLADPSGYGRIIRNDRGEPRAIVEEKWLTDDQRSIDEVNTGIYVIDAGWLRGVLPALPRHGDDELYLTDIAERAAAEDGLLVVPDAAHDEVAGINDRVGLAHAEKVMRRRINEAIMRQGVSLIDPETTYIAADAAIGSDTIVEPNVIIDTGVTIGQRCHIGAQTRILASALGDDCRVLSSQIEFSEIGDRVQIGPFSHLRAGSILAADVHIGNFAELKNSSLGEGTKMGHFSYLGDATVGTRVNVGAGTITANYDGTAKHRTVVGNHVFLGVGTMLRAPVTIADRAYTGAGSVVLRDVPESTTVVGVPARAIERREQERTQGG
jgi:bifunctional UDP-N-acetylglucosamine pyrophosphorylase/glucosamine-1-phosphate N-acetyltransferase